MHRELMLIQDMDTPGRALEVGVNITTNDEPERAMKLTIGDSSVVVDGDVLYKTLRRLMRDSEPNTFRFWRK